MGKIWDAIVKDFEALDRELSHIEIEQVKKANGDTGLRISKHDTNEEIMIVNKGGDRYFKIGKRRDKNGILVRTNRSNSDSLIDYDSDTRTEINF
jgi:hypothetical protein